MRVAETLQQSTVTEDSSGNGRQLESESSLTLIKPVYYRLREWAMDDSTVAVTTQSTDRTVAGCYFCPLLRLIDSSARRRCTRKSEMGTRTGPLWANGLTG